ncbi:hypothetical protein D3C80_2012310 [compost metagenome]
MLSLECVENGSIGFSKRAGIVFDPLNRIVRVNLTIDFRERINPIRFIWVLEPLLTDHL